MAAFSSLVKFKSSGSGTGRLPPPQEIVQIGMILDIRIIKIDDLFQCCKPAIVHVTAADLYVSQRGNFESPVTRARVRYGSQVQANVPGPIRDVGRGFMAPVAAHRKRTQSVEQSNAQQLFRSVDSLKIRLAIGAGRKCGIIFH